MQFDLRAATLRSELAQIEQDYLSCMIQLKALLGEDVIQSVTPSGDLIHQHIQGTVTDYVNADLTSSPMIRAATNDFDAASTRASAARGRWLPRLDIEGSFGELPQPQGEEKNKFGSTFALVATWEIFGGFDTIYQVQELNAVRSGTNAQLKADIRSLLTSIQIGFGEVETLQRRADFEKNNILTAKKHYELVFADFKRGYKNSSDFSDAAQAWYDAEVGRKKLDLEFIERKIDLEQKLGRQVSTIPMKDVVAGPEGKL
jgi:outer membrane protein TolC